MQQFHRRRPQHSRGTRPPHKERGYVLITMLNVSDPEHPYQTGIVSLGVDAGPHAIALTDDDKRLVVTDYFLNEDNFGKIHFEGDHHVHVIRVHKDDLKLDPRFDVDFNNAFPTGPARPHGIAMK